MIEMDRIYPDGDLWLMYTDDTDLVRKMSRKVGFECGAEYRNVQRWCFHFHAKRPDSAIRTFKRIVGRNPIYDAAEGLYV